MPAASGADAAITTVRYGSTFTSAPAPAAVAGGSAACLPFGFWGTGGADIILARRLESQHRPASRANTPRKTAPCALAGPAPLSQCVPSGTPNRSLESSVLGFPPTRGDRNSR